MLTTKNLHIECAEITVIDSGFILLKYKPDYEVEIEDVKELEKVLIEISDNGDIYCLMDTSGRLNNYSHEAQKFLSNDASIVKQNKIKGSAIVIDNLPNRLLARFFSKFYKPKFPMKIFRNKEDALSWLELLRDRQNTT